MPYYRWSGVGLDGVLQSGRLYAADTTTLNTLLFKKDIALITCKPCSTLMLAPITQQTKKDYFERLALLLSAGVLVPQAHWMLRDHLGNIKMQIVLEKIVADIEQGIQLSAAMAQHPNIFDNRMVHMVLIGQESGNLAQTAQAMAHYLETTISFKSRIRASLSMPLISFGFFLVILAVIIVAIVPTVASVLASLHLPLPYATQLLLTVGLFLKTWTGLGIVALLMFGIVMLVRTISRKRRTVEYFHAVVLRIPVIKTIVCNMQRAWFLNSLALLLRGGMQLVPALHIACHSYTNRVLAMAAASIPQNVTEGSSFTNALELCSGQCFDQETIAIIHIGQDSGNFVSSIEQAATLSSRRALHLIERSSQLISPLFLIVLGLLISLLIVVIYTPIFTISAGI